MPNLVGIGLSQVPTNGMLGGMAYQDPEHASIKNLDLKNLSQINAEIADTAVDVFVYDTRKDSDGGAWRKRTQNTSWYNETLGTATRGTRREFPAVAVIVIERQKIRIYDGDGPDLSMWMVFEINEYSNSGNLGYTPIGIGHVSSHPMNSVSLSSVHMLNGFLFIGGNRDTNTNSVHAGYDINFISEVMHEYLHYPLDATATTKWKLNGNVSQRNSTAVVLHPSSRYAASGNSVGLRFVANDVAMTVLPNAPIDPSTGLPVPTIAVGVGVAGAANGGVSVIKDDGTVVDIIASTGGGGYGSYHVAFGSNNELIHTQTYNTAYASVNIFDIIPSSDISATNSYSAARTYPYINSVPNIRGGINGISTPNLGYVSNSTNGDIAFGFKNINAKLSLLSENKTDPTKSMVAYIASDYNTGWMHGDIKGAFLSDTDTTNATELITNGYFNSDVSGWSIGSTGTTATLDSNRMLVTAPTSGASWGYVYQAITTEIGKTYKIELYYDRGTVDGRIVVRNNSSNVSAGLLKGVGVNAGGWRDLGASDDAKTIYATFTATATTTYILLYSKNVSGGTNAYDRISVTLEKDRSVNNKGLRVYGTVTKTPVATGADLVAYSGFSNSNYLMQPHNTDLEIGTGEISISAWFKSSTSDTSNYKGLFYLNNPGSLGPGLQVMLGPDNGLYLYIYGVSGSQNFSGNYQYGYNDGNWHQVLVSTKPGQQQIYVDGILKQTGTVNTGSMTNSTSELYIGRWYGNANVSSYWWRGDIALVRVSRSIPSAEQVKKMYEDEKCLFHENANATLYGSSDAVTGLAFDDTTNLLHVGTSAGRSEFQGLRRINNTTDAITTAISASNGLVAEQ